MMDIALKFNADMVVCDYILEYKKNKFVYQKGMKDACDAFDFLKITYQLITSMKLYIITVMMHHL